MVGASIHYPKITPTSHSNKHKGISGCLWLVKNFVTAVESFCHPKYRLVAKTIQICNLFLDLDITLTSLTMDNISRLYASRFHLAAELAKQNKKAECLDICWELRCKPGKFS